MSDLHKSTLVLIKLKIKHRQFYILIHMLYLN
jgi:hypothetical protein